MYKPVAQPKSATKDHAPAGRTLRQRAASPPGILLLLFVVMGCGLGTWRLFFYSSPASRGLQVLQTAYRAARPLEARFSGFAYAPFVSLRGEQTVDDAAHTLAARLLIEAVTDSPSAESHHSLGLYYLAGREYDRAIGEFEAALQADAENALLHSDLGAALFERGRSVDASDEDGSKVEFFARSLTYMNRALKLDPDLHEAIFNRALLREQMILTEGATEDWRAYLEKDPNSAWSEEARNHLNRLEERRSRTEQSQQNLVEDFLNAYRAGDAERVWALFSPNREKLTTELLAAYLKSDAEATKDSRREAIDALAYAGELDTRSVGDHYTADTAGFYRFSSPQKLAKAREAQEMMRKGRELYTRGQVERAYELRDQARQIFSQIGDVCGARLATYWSALHCWELGRTQKSKSLLDRLLRDCEAGQYHWLHLRTLYQQASISIKLDEYSNVFAFYHQMQEMAEKLNDPLSALDASSGLIEHYRLLGNRPECLRQMGASWSLLDRSPLSSLPFWRQYNVQATALNTFGFYDAAIAYARESLRFATATNNSVMLSFSYAHLGLTYGNAQNFEKAFGSVKQAYAIAAAHSDKSLGQLMMAYAAVQMGHLHRECGEFAEALDQYDQAIELHKRHALDFSTHLYQAYKGRLACCMALNDISAAQQQLATLLEVMDKHRTRIVEEENRDNFFDVEQSVYDMGTDLAHSRMQDWQQSFVYAETSRARSLLDSMRVGAQVVERGGKLDLLLQAAAQPLPSDEIRARIPGNTRLLEYAVLDDKLLVWVISPDGLQPPVTVPVSQVVLTEKINRFLATLQGASDEEGRETEHLARELFDYLIAPVEALLGDCRSLVIVPDKILNRLPWDALVSP
ncbi:MAG: CHAT domain-containing protein, partial [Blastocatellia bacterium]|nr:CHAT domain-containing protein [Blastocatellia bacterium]